MRKRRWRSGLDVSSRWLPVWQLNLHARYQHRVFTRQWELWDGEMHAVQMVVLRIFDLSAFP